MTSSFINNSSVSSALINFKSLDNRSSVSTSLTEPNAILRKCINSFFDFLPAPSAIFVGIETEALRSCEVNPNFSDDGNASVASYISFTNSKLSFHASSYLCGFSDMTNYFIKGSYSSYCLHLTNNISCLTSNI